jgi:DnaJ-class molecular chaperone
MPAPTSEKCGECGGTGVVTVRYEWRGVIGDGEARCPECKGTGKVVPVGRVERP